MISIERDKLKFNLSEINFLISHAGYSNFYNLILFHAEKINSSYLTF